MATFCSKILDSLLLLSKKIPHWKSINAIIECNGKMEENSIRVHRKSIYVTKVRKQIRDRVNRYHPFYESCISLYSGFGPNRISAPARSISLENIYWTCQVQNVFMIATFRSASSVSLYKWSCKYSIKQFCKFHTSLKICIGNLAVINSTRRFFFRTYFALNLLVFRYENSNQFGLNRDGCTTLVISEQNILLILFKTSGVVVNKRFEVWGSMFERNILWTFSWYYLANTKFSNTKT